MKTTLRNISNHLLVLCFFAGTLSARAQNTAFTYQGRLNSSGNPANGSFDLTFELFNAATNGTATGPILTNSATAVSNGLFTVRLDFGSAIIGSNFWVAIGARTNGGGAFTSLVPRLPLTPAPYAISAGTLTGVLPGGGLSGNYPSPVTITNSADVFAGSFSGNGAGLTNITATTAGTTHNFSGPLSGDVTGTQLATVVATVGGQSAANVASATVAANAAAVAGTPNTLVKRDAGGGISAANVTANTYYGNGSNLTHLNANNLTGGTVPLAQLPAAFALLNGGNSMTGSNNFSGVVVANNPHNVLSGAFSGNGGGLTNINAASANTAVTAASATTAATATTAHSFSGPLAGDVTGTQGATVVASVGGQSAANVAKGSGAANNAAVTAAPNSLAKRDFQGGLTAATFSGDGSSLTNLNANNLTSGTVPLALLPASVTSLSSNVVLINGTNNFTGPNSYAGVLVATNPNNVFAGTILGGFAGNATSATTAATANNFSGPLSGDVTGTQFGTVVTSVGGQSAASVASGSRAANGATHVVTPNTIVSRDAAGGFSAGTITANSFSGGGANLTGLNANNITTGIVPLSRLPASVTSFPNNIALLNGNNNLSGIVIANNPSNIVNGTFIGDGAGLSNVTATTALTANSAITANSATTATGFSGPLAGDVIGTQLGTTVANVAGVPAASIANGASAANGATSANAANKIVSRDANGGFLAGAITANSISGDGANVTNLNANNLASGTVPLAQLPANVALVDGANSFSGTNTYTGIVIATNVNNIISGTISGDGSGLTNLNVATVSGILPGGNLSGTYPNQVSLTDAANTFAGSFSGDGSGLANLNASQLTTGTVPLAQLPPSVTSLTTNSALLNGANAFTGNNNYSGVVVATNAGNVIAGTFTGNLTGNASTASSAVTAANANTANSATTAATANNFTGALAGDVTGTQGATVVSKVGGVIASNVASGIAALNAATSANGTNTLVTRDASGNFSAGAITAGSFSGNGSNLTSLNASSLASGIVPLAQLPASVTSLSTNSALLNGTNAFTGPNTYAGAIVATNANNIFAGAFTGNLTGNATSANSALTAANANTAASATTANTANNFTGTLIGDVTGTQGATVVSKVGGVIASNVANGIGTLNAATSANVPNTLITRDAAGNFSAAAITATSFAGNGANLTSLSASNLTGTVAVGQLPASVTSLSTNSALLNGTNSFTGTNSYSGVVLATNANNIFNGTLSGNGAGLTNLSVATFTGTLASGSLSGTYSNTVNLSSGANSFTGSFNGNGANLTGLNASNLASGTVALALLPAAVVTNSEPSVSLGNLFLDGLNLNAITSGGGITSGESSFLHAFGNNNFFAGLGAGNFSTSGNGGNTGVGAAALALNTTGYNNTANGFAALFSNTTGSNNTAEGFEALTANTTARGNTAVGYIGLGANTTGIQNTAIGTGVLQANTVGNQNTGLGVNALTQNTNGSFNTASGGFALFASASGSNNTANGYDALLNSTGSGNIALGYQAGLNIISGGNNIDIGSAGISNDSSIIRIGTPGLHSNTFIAGVISGDGSGLTNLTAGTATTAVTASNFTGTLSGDVTGTQTNTTVAKVGGVNASNVANGISTLNAATSADVTNALVTRDAFGNFSAGGITALTFSGDGSNLSGLNASNLASGTVPLAQLPASITSLPGTVALLNGANTFSGTNSFGGVTIATNAGNIFTGNGAGLTNVTAATANVATTAVTASNFTGTLFGDVTGRQGATVVSQVGGITASNLAADIFTLNAATSANVSNTLVTRDAFGDFSAEAITANFFSGDGSSLFNLSVSTLASGAALGSGSGNFIPGGGVLFPFIGGGQGNSMGESTSYLFIGGGESNSIGASVEDATITGGYLNNENASFSFIGGGGNNVVSGFAGTIAGGEFNASIGTYAAIAGGFNSLSYGNFGSVGGGEYNDLNGDYAVIGGGYNNFTSGLYSAIGSGSNNYSGGTASVVPGGAGNSAIGDYSFAAGYFAVATNQGSFVWSDFETNAGTFADTASNQFAVRANGGVRFVTSGAGLTVDGQAVLVGGTANVQANSQGSFIGGGQSNVIQFTTYGVIAGGQNNQIQDESEYGAIVGGQNNVVESILGFVGGGYGNTATGFGVVGGGYENYDFASYGTVSGGDNNIVDNSFGAIGGGYSNYVAGSSGVVAGGELNNSGGNYATIAGGLQNSNSGTYSFIGGGFANIAGGTASTVAGGIQNTNTGANSLIGAGGQNICLGGYSFIGGGEYNAVSLSGSAFGTIGGGNGNVITGNYGTIPGGFDNTATNFAFAAGSDALAVHPSSFVWSDGSATTSSTANNSVTMRASGGYRLFSGTSATNGVSLAPNGTAWATVSDRNAKKNIVPVNGQAVLDKLAQVPIAQWNYKWEKDSDVPNIGPMAQDFKGAFYPGRDDKSITTLEFDGVELAAIQALNKKVENQAKELKSKDAAIEALEKRLDRLETALSRLPNQQITQQ